MSNDKRVFAAEILRSSVRGMFEDIDLSAREQEWVDRDSFDAGLVSGAKYLLAIADKIEAGE